MQQITRSRNVFKVTTYNVMKLVTKSTSTCDRTRSIAPSVPGVRKDIMFTAGVGQREGHVSSRHI
jgi:hypothetical protein